MNLNLDPLYLEILEEIKRRNLVPFHAELRAVDRESLIVWDVKSCPDYKQFLDAAAAAGSRMITVVATKFDQREIDRSIDDMDGLPLDRKEQRAIEQKLKELRIYDSLICYLELSFNAPPHDYTFELKTDWYEQYMEAADLIDEAFVEFEETDIEEDEGGPMDGGYYSKN